MTTSAAATAFAAAPAAAPAPAGAPAAAPAAAAPAPMPGGAAAAPAANGNWYDGFENADVKTWTAAKGFKDPAAVAESAYNLEKLIGFDRAGRTLVLPKDDATPEEMKAFNTKLGVPETPEGYKLDALADTSPEFQKVAKGWMHKAGIPPKQANALAAEFKAFSATQQQVAEADLITSSDKALSSTMAAWGKDADANLELGKRFASQIIPDQVELDDGSKVSRQDLLERVFNRTGATGAMLKLFAQAGQGLGEHKVGNNGEPPNAGGMTAQQANVRIAALKGDAEWAKSYLGGDKAKLAEMSRLIAIANGVQPG